MALKSFRDRDKVVVGAVSLAVIAALLAGTFFGGTLGIFDSGYVMTGIFADSGGLRTGNDVRVAGVRVGKVTEIRPDYGQGVVVVTWTVDPAVRLGARQTRAEVALSNLLGGSYLKLSGPVAPPYMDQLPEARRQVPMERTGTPVLINDALKDATRVVQRLDTKEVDRLLTELSQLNTGKRGKVTRLLDNIGQLSDTISKSEPDLRRLLDNTSRVMNLLQSKDKQINRLMDTIQVMLDELRRRRGELTTLLGDGSQLVASITKLIDEHERSLIAAVDNTGAITRGLSGQAEGINNTLAWIGPTFSGLATIGGEGPWIEAIAGQLGPVNPEVLGAIRRDRSSR
jgi:phospholipid/cholesterol/gamma-HCH transport system substrate-binding protein